MIGTVSIVSTVYAAPARLTRRPSVRKIIEKGIFLLQAKKNRLKEIRRQKGGDNPKMRARASPKRAQIPIKRIRIILSRSKKEHKKTAQNGGKKRGGRPHRLKQGQPPEGRRTNARTVIIIAAAGNFFKKGLFFYE